MSVIIVVKLNKVNSCMWDILAEFMNSLLNKLGQLIQFLLIQILLPCTWY